MYWKLLREKSATTPLTGKESDVIVLTERRVVIGIYNALTTEPTRRLNRNEVKGKMRVILEGLWVGLRNIHG